MYSSHQPRFDCALFSVPVPCSVLGRLVVLVFHFIHSLLVVLISDAKVSTIFQACKHFQ